MRYVKCETAGKENTTPDDILKRCERNYYERGGRERSRDYYMNRVTPEQRAQKQQRCREWKARNRDRMRVLRLASNTKARVLKKTGMADFDVWDMIGCDCAELSVYLYAQCEPGVDWRNGRIFEIDHITPLSSFDLSKPSQIRECLHFSNLQVLLKEPHGCKSKNEHFAFMDSLSRKWWSEVRDTPYPGFAIAWREFSRRTIANSK